MRVCAQCGLSIGAAATFCTVCGARADAPRDAAPTAPDLRAVQNGDSVDDQVADEAGSASGGHGDALSRRLNEAALPMREAQGCEKTDAARSAALYRQAILRYLEAAADPLGREDVRHDLLLSFDRLSLVLKRDGSPEEALEEIDCAASLGLLDCQDHGIKGHREALKKRQVSLRRALNGDGPPH